MGELADLRAVLASSKPSRMPCGYRAEDHMPGVVTDGFVPVAEAAATMG